MPSEARQKKIMEKLNRAQKCSILGPQNLGSGGARAPGVPPLDPHLNWKHVNVGFERFLADVLKYFWIGHTYADSFWGKNSFHCAIRHVTKYAISTDSWNCNNCKIIFTGVQRTNNFLSTKCTLQEVQTCRGFVSCIWKHTTKIFTKYILLCNCTFYINIRKWRNYTTVTGHHAWMLHLNVMPEC